MNFAYGHKQTYGDINEELNIQATVYWRNSALFREDAPNILPCLDTLSLLSPVNILPSTYYVF